MPIPKVTSAALSWLTAFLTTGLFGMGCMSAQSPRVESPADPIMEVEYTVRLTAAQREQVHVTLNVRGLEPNSAVSLVMPTGHTFFSFSEPLLAHLSGGGITPMEPYRWTAVASARGELLIEWSVPMVHRERLPEGDPGAYEHPYIQADHGMLTSATMFLIPEVEFEFAQVRFDLPPAWSVITPWNRHAGDGERFDVERSGVENDIVAVGDWDVFDIHALGCRVTVAYAPGQRSLSELVNPLISRIVRAEGAVFGVQPCDEYLMLFGRADSPYLSGSPKAHSMTLSVPKGLAADSFLPELAHLVAHEFHHTWTSHIDFPDELRFYGEGFTDYVSYKTLLNLDIISRRRFSEIANYSINRYRDMSAATGMTLAQAGGSAFFEDEAAHDMVYAGGFTLALLIDLATRHDSERGGLLDLMREFNNDPRWVTNPPSLGDLAIVSERYLGQRSNILEAASAEMPLDLPGLFDAVGVVTRSRVKAPERGFRLDNLTVADLRSADIAHQFGLREGDKITMVNQQSVETDAEVQRMWDAAAAVGHGIQLVVVRDGETIEVVMPASEVLVVDFDET